MFIIDLILLFTWAGFVFYGLFFGLIRTLGSLLGVVAGTWVASLFYLELFSLIESWFFGLDNLGKIISFIFLFLIANRLVRLVFVLLDKAFSIFSIIPFMTTFNRVSGAILGLFEGALVLGVLLYLAVEHLPWIPFEVSESLIVPYLLDFVRLLVPLLSQALSNYL